MLDSPVVGFDGCNVVEHCLPIMRLKVIKMVGITGQETYIYICAIHHIKG